MPPPFKVHNCNGLESGKKKTETEGALGRCLPGQAFQGTQVDPPRGLGLALGQGILVPKVSEVPKRFIFGANSAHDEADAGRCWHFFEDSTISFIFARHLLPHVCLMVSIWGIFKHFFLSVCHLEFAIF